MPEVFDLAKFRPDAHMQSVIDRYENTPTDNLIASQTRIYDRQSGVEALLAEPHEAPGIRESEFVISHGLAFGNEIKTKFNAVRAQFTADVHGVPVYVFSSPLDHRIFDGHERAVLNEGDFTPYSDRYLRFLDNASIGTGKVAVIGFSMAASVSANAAHRLNDHFDVPFAVLGDPVNVKDRSLRDLAGDFGKHGFSEVARNVKNAGLRPYIETQKVNEKKNFVAEQLSLLRYVGKIASDSKSNLLAARALSRDTLGHDLIDNSRVPTLIAYGAQSAITPPQEAERLQAEYGADNIAWLRVEDSGNEAGHTWGDHITAWTYITKFAAAS